jgi:hypothetical protein
VFRKYPSYNNLFKNKKMKTKLYSIILTIICLTNFDGFSCTMQGNGLLMESEKSGFNTIVLKTYANVVITQGEKISVTIKTDDNSFTNVQCKIKDDKLVISCSDNKIINNNPVVYITVKSLVKLEHSGSGNISFTNQIKSNNMDLRLTGSGNLKANIDVKNMKVVVSGSGDLEMTGKSANSNITLSGSGNVNGQDLKASKSNIKVSGSGSGIVDVEDFLEVDITGSGNVFFISYPERVTAISYGSGRCEKLKA